EYLRERLDHEAQGHAARLARAMAKAREVRAVEVLHHDVVAASLLADLVGLHDVGVRELRGDARLVEEHRREHRLAGEPRELDDEQLLESARSLRAREIDVGHPSLAQQCDEAIAT